MNWLYSLVIGFSMYSKLPMPRVEWTKERMQYALCFFPVVGVLIGGCIVVGGWVSRWLSLGVVSYSVIGMVIPIAITGGIHMDGFLDVTDARSSRQSRERKLEIMKDPHTGAFAILFGGIYLLSYVAVWSELSPTGLPAVAGIYVLIRALSGWSVVTFKKAKAEGLVSTFAVQARTRVVQGVMIGWAVMAAGYMIFVGGLVFGVGALLLSLLVCVWYYIISMNEFGGITGDLAGYFLQVGELCLLVWASILF